MYPPYANMIRSPSKPRPASRVFAKWRGFTLIEMAVVVIIVTMLISLGLGVLNAQLASAAQAETKKRQALIKDALIAYLGAHKRLPCPDIPNRTHDTADTSQVSGAEDRAGAVDTGTCSGQIGVVPYATLGLSRELALDGWGNFMSYSVATGGTPCPGTGIDWSLSACFGAAKSAPYAVFEGTVAAPVAVAANVLAVIVSHGPNGFAAWASQGTRNVLPSQCEEAHNAIATVAGCTLTANRFYRGERSEVDDVLAHVTRDEAINTLAAQGTLKSAEAQVMQDLARLKNNQRYEKVQTCIVSPVADLDPWGNVYGRVEGAAVSGLPICLCSTRGSGALPAAPAAGTNCNPTAPTTCMQIDESEVNLLRLSMGLAPC